jgi:hypothetical protein
MPHSANHEPTFMLGVLSGLVWPQIRVEIEVTAVRPAHDADRAG